MTHLRFRAWHKPTNKMIDLRAITPLALDSNLKQEGVFIPFDDETVVMQSTGLTDKNGKEIFEGDILAVPKYMFGQEYALDNYEVKFYKGVFGIGEDHERKGIAPLCRTEKPVEATKEYIPNFGDYYREHTPCVEIIGDIYSTPSLIR